MKSKLIAFLQLLLIFMLVQACAAEPATEQPVESTKVGIPQPDDLFKAIASGDIETVQLYIDSEQDLDVVNSDGETAVFAAVERRDFSILRLLVDAGADIQTGNPFECAINNEDFNCVFILYDRSDEDLFEYAISNRISWLAAGLIHSGSGVALKTSREEYKADELLFYAIKHDLPDVALALLKNEEASQAQTDAHGNSSMTLARERFSLNSDLLKALKVDSNYGLLKQDFYGDWTPIGGYGPKISFNEDGSCKLQFVKDMAGPGLAMAGKFIFRNVNGSSQIKMELTVAEVDERYGDWSPRTETIQINFLSKKRMELVFLDSDESSDDRTWVVTKKLVDIVESPLPEDKLGFTLLMEYCSDLDTSVLNDHMWDMYYPNMTVDEINATDYHGRNALLWTQMFYPATIDSETIIHTLEFLIKKGIDLACRDNDGKNIYDYIEALYYNKEDSKYLALIEFLEPYKDQIIGAPVVNTATSRFLNAENIPVESIQDIPYFNGGYGMTAPPLLPYSDVELVYDGEYEKVILSKIRIDDSVKVVARSPSGREFTRNFSAEEFSDLEDLYIGDEAKKFSGFNFYIDIDFVPGKWTIKLYPDGATESFDYTFNTTYIINLDTKSVSDFENIKFGFPGERSPFDSCDNVVVQTGKKMTFVGRNFEPDSTITLGLFYNTTEDDYNEEMTLAPKVAAYVETDESGSFTVELDMQNDLIDGVYYMASGDYIEDFNASRFDPVIKMDPQIAINYKEFEAESEAAKSIEEKLIGYWENTEFMWNDTITLSESGLCSYQPCQESPSHDGTYIVNEVESILLLNLTDLDGTEYQQEIEVVMNDNLLEGLYSPELDLHFTKVGALYSTGE